MLPLNNATLIECLIKGQEAEVAPLELAMLLKRLAERIINKPGYRTLLDGDVLMGIAFTAMLKRWRSFNLEKSQNPFAYFHCVGVSAILAYTHSKRAESYEGWNRSFTAAFDGRRALARSLMGHASHEPVAKCGFRRSDDPRPDLTRS
jgi:hypothetical protein